MKKIKLSIVFILCISLFPIKLSSQQMTYTNLRSGDGITVNYKVNDFHFETVEYLREEMKEIVLSGIFIPNDSSQNWRCKNCSYKKHCDEWFER